MIFNAEQTEMMSLEQLQASMVDPYFCILLYALNSFKQKIDF